MMVAGEHLMMYHHLTADLMLIQELHGSHNSDIWNYPLYQVFWFKPRKTERMSFPNDAALTGSNLCSLQ